MSNVVKSSKKSVFKKVVFFLLILFVLIQFIQPEENNSTSLTNSIVSVESIPDDVHSLLKNACFDCHSNFTKYPWYAKVAPISWYINNHVKQGREHLNFSEWTNYNKEQKEHVIHELEEVIEEQKMPLQTYIWLHDESTLTEAQNQLLLNWIATLKK